MPPGRSAHSGADTLRSPPSRRLRSPWPRAAARTAAGTLNLSKPSEGGGQREDNPFSLVLSVGQPSQSGAVSFWSAGVATTSGQDAAGNPQDPQVLLTYWDLEWTGSKLSGNLTAAHSDKGATLNLLNWPSLLVPCRPELGTLPGGFPHPVRTGATLTGDLNASRTSLSARGVTSDGTLEFAFSFSGAS